jgi:FkbM family methyltransferase
VSAPEDELPLAPEDFVRNARLFEQYWLYGHLRTLLSLLNVSCVLDVGAHVGEFAIALRTLAGYEGWMLSFEPVSRPHDKLKTRSEHLERWNVFKMALGSRNEERSIKVAELDVFSSFLGRSEFGAETFRKMMDVTTEEVVPVRTLDSVVPEVMDGIPGDRIFLKVDTQGWDLEVLKGATQTLPRVVGLLTELSVQGIYQGSPHYTETLAYLESLGFELSGLFPVVRDRALRLVELDCVMVRPPAGKPPA